MNEKRTGNFKWDDGDIYFVLDPTRLVLVFIVTVLTHWNNSPGVDISLYSEILSCFRAYQSSLLPLYTVCLADNQQMPILHSPLYILVDSH